jgi:hypothetical protein
MTENEIIEMARQAGMIPLEGAVNALGKSVPLDWLMDFANEIYQLGRTHGKQFEREECAKACEEEKDIDGISTAKAFAEIIRARGQE